MSSFEQWQQTHGNDPWAMSPPSDADWGFSSYAPGPDTGYAGGGFDDYLCGGDVGSSRTASPRAETGLGAIGFGETAPEVGSFEDYLQDQTRGGRPQPAATLEFSAADVMAYPAPPAYVPYRRPERRERRNWTGILAGIGAFALAGALAVSAFTSRGHVEAHSAPSPTPTATGKANPGQNGPKWLQIFNAKTGTINMANAAKDAEQVPQAVRNTAGSVEEILNYQNPNANGVTYGEAGTGYVENINGRNWLISAAHCVAGTPDSLPNPNYIIETNVNGTEHKDLVLEFQVPASYDRLTDTFIDSPSEDLSIIGIMPVEWWDGSGRHTGDNGWNEIPALENATSKPSVGSLLFTYGYRPASGPEMEPPQKPVLQAMVVVGYSDDGSRMVLLPVDTQRASTQQEGNSGSAIVNKLGKVTSTLIAGGSETEQWFQQAYHVKVLGGDGAQIDPGQIRFEIATVNSPRNFAQVQVAKPTRPDFPAHIPG